MDEKMQNEIYKMQNLLMDEKMNYRLAPYGEPKWIF
jgi:hypothetical protein